MGGVTLDGVKLHIVEVVIAKDSEVVIMEGDDGDCEGIDGVVEVGGINTANGEAKASVKVSEVGKGQYAVALHGHQHPRYA